MFLDSDLPGFRHAWCHMKLILYVCYAAYGGIGGYNNIRRVAPAETCRRQHVRVRNYIPGFRHLLLSSLWRQSSSYWLKWCRMTRIQLVRQCQQIQKYVGQWHQLMALPRKYQRPRTRLALAQHMDLTVTCLDKPSLVRMPFDIAKFSDPHPRMVHFKSRRRNWLAYRCSGVKQEICVIPPGT